MFEKVNPAHPDKIADRIAGALVDIAYKKEDNPKIAVEVLIGHGECHIIAETSLKLDIKEVETAVKRIAGDVKIDYVEVPQDTYLANNQFGKIRCGDNGIFKGVPITREQWQLTTLAMWFYDDFKADGKFILDGRKLIICQSNIKTKDTISLRNLQYKYPFLKSNDFDVKLNPIGDWVGGINVDTGATNRKLGSDMGDSVTGGGLHGKDLSKADVSVNIYCFLKAQETGKEIEISCAIGDEFIDNKPYSEIVEIAREFINQRGGFEKFAEWGLI